MRCGARVLGRYLHRSPGMMQRFAPEFMCLIVQHDGLLKGVLSVSGLAGSRPLRCRSPAGLAFVLARFPPTYVRGQRMSSLRDWVLPARPSFLGHSLVPCKPRMPSGNAVAALGVADESGVLRLRPAFAALLRMTVWRGLQSEKAYRFGRILRGFRVMRVAEKQTRRS
jgi:hypothetical protein